MNWLSYLLAIGAGAVNPTQTAANSQLNKSLHSALWAGAFVYLSGLICLSLILALARKTLPGSGAMAQAPWWAWVGGVLSLASTMSGLVFAQKMGSGTYTGLTVTASLVTSILLDHFGLIGFKVHPVSVLRVAGAGLMILGLWLVAKS
ncbi:MAG: hypothetical protein JWP63_6034 [Candidatus Solibacter sp.]|nr:hypothetical protein [Candidatus Solibacter sp.]